LAQRVFLNSYDIQDESVKKMPEGTFTSVTGFKSPWRRQASKRPGSFSEAFHVFEDQRDALIFLGWMVIGRMELVGNWFL
jgi:hypothetical protein